MNKSELVKVVEQATGVAKRDVDAAVNATIHTIMKELKAGRSVTLSRFGTFSAARRAARKGRNPRTGESVRIPVHKGVRFKPSLALKDVVNGKQPLGGPVKNEQAKAVAKRAPAAKRAPGTAKAATKAAPATKAAAKRTPAAKAATKAAPARAAAKRAPAAKAAPAAARRGRKAPVNA